MKARVRLNALDALRRKRIVIAGLVIACALASAYLYTQQSHLVAKAKTSYSAANGGTHEMSRTQPDAIARDSAMTISVSPRAQLQANGKLRINVRNVRKNKCPLRFRVIQGDASIYESDVVATGKQSRPVPPKPPRRAKRISKLPQTYTACFYTTHHVCGNPIRVKVQVIKAN